MKWRSKEEVRELKRLVKLQIKKRGFKFRFCLLKGYLDTGRGLTDYFKEMILIFGLASFAVGINMMWTILALILYFSASWIVGYLWMMHGMQDAQAEVGNIFNPFCKDVRNSLKEKTLKSSLRQK